MSLFDGSASVQHTERKGKPIGQQVRLFLLYRLGHMLKMPLLVSFQLDASLLYRLDPILQLHLLLSAPISYVHHVGI